jgi:Ca2+/Na+ antiporter
MPTLPEVLAQLSFLTTKAAIVGLVITASLIVVIRDWRLLLTALSVQYLLAGLLLTRLIQPQVAVIKVLIGALVCVVLYLTARLAVVREKEAALEQEAAEDSGSSIRTIGGEVSLADFAFQLLAALFVGLVAYSLSKRYPLPEIPPDIGLTCYWLASLGLLVLMLTEEPLKAGMGLLTLITGFELFYSALEHSLSVAGFLGIANFLIALAITYLTAASEAELTAGERER